MYCKKKSFNTIADANRRIKEILSEYNEERSKVPIRSYECPYCKKIHITSMTQSEQQKVLNRYENYHTKFIIKEGRYWNKKLDTEITFEKFKKRKNEL